MAATSGRFGILGFLARAGAMACMLVMPRVVPAGPIASADEAVARARQWLGQYTAHPTREATLDRYEARARRGAAWIVSLRSPEGSDNLMMLDAETGDVLQWALTGRETSSVKPSPDPQVGVDESRRIAMNYAAQLMPSFRTGVWEPALGGTPLKVSGGDEWAWYPVVDTDTGALGPNDLAVDVDTTTGAVIGFLRPYEGPLWVSTRPSIGRLQILRLARRYAILDPALYPINHVTLRVGMEDHGSQRLVWECLQVLSVSPETGVMMYGVVFDAHTGEPLYPIAPIGRGKYAVRQINFPRRISVRIEPGGRAMATSLAPPLLRDGILQIRAEHLRAVDGVRVDVDRAGVTVRRGDSVVNGKELGAEWRDYGWWVPLRRAARALGWRVEWNGVRKEAVIHPDG